MAVPPAAGTPPNNGAAMNDPLVEEEDDDHLGFQHREHVDLPSQVHLPQRPSLVRLSRTSAAHHSSPSIMTMSKMYQEQKHQHAKMEETPAVSPSAGSGRMDFHRSAAKKVRKVRLIASQDNDYFASGRRGTGSTSGSSSNSGTDGASSIHRLPSFQSFSKEDLTKLHPTFKPRGMASSKIYERRMKQLSENTAEREDTSNVLMDQASNDEEQEHQYRLKLEKMTSGRCGSAKFFQEDSEESDIDIHSEAEDLHKNKSYDGRETTINRDYPDKISSKNALGSGVLPTEDATKDDDQHKKQGFFSRLAFGEAEHDFDPQRTLLYRMVHHGDGSTPNNGRKHTADDEEATIGMDNNHNGFPLQQLDPEVFEREAREILKSHNYAISTSSSTQARAESLEGKTLQNLRATDEFLAPYPDLYNHDESDIKAYDANDPISTDYIPPPEQVRSGVLSALLKLYHGQTSQGGSLQSSPLPSGASTPGFERSSMFDSRTLTDKVKGYSMYSSDNSLSHRRNDSTDILFKTESFLKKKRRDSSSTNLPSFNRTNKKQRPKLKKGTSGLLKTRREQARARITVHIADVLHRQRFVLRMCKGLMLYGAPTHRLEEYLTMTSRVLEIDGQFIYLPGCMVVSFGDPTTRTSEVQLVKCAQGLNMYKLHRIHRIYKQVIHDFIGVDEASAELEKLLAQKPTFAPWMCALIYGFSSSMVTPFAFGGGWINLPVAFGIGCVVGVMQYLIAPRSQLYINVFEIAASIAVSFLGRALGSIKGSGICFGSIVQGSLALILPGWLIMCGALELQSRNLVAGSVRVMYAIIYSLFLGYGITLGSALYGWMDKNATSELTCSTSLNPWFRFLFVPGFTVGLALINQARLFQLPIIVLISGSGYAVSYFASKHFHNSTQLTAAMASFVIGIMGNLYSRIFKGIAFTAMLPAVFVLIPAGLASANSLLSGVQSADQIVNNKSSSSASEQVFSSISVGITLLNICIGITVGLFASAIVVYPLGKRSTALFSL